MSKSIYKSQTAMDSEIRKIARKQSGDGTANDCCIEALRAWLAKHGTRDDGLKEAAEASRKLDHHCACAEEIEALRSAESGRAG